MAHPVVHWEIGARDAAALRAFYSELFGWEITGAPDYGLVTPGEGGIGGGIMQIREGMPPYVTVYAGVEDLTATLARAGRLGGGTLVPPTQIPGVGEFAMFTDPEGNAIGLMQSTMPVVSRRPS